MSRAPQSADGKRALEIIEQAARRSRYTDPAEVHEAWVTATDNAETRQRGFVLAPKIANALRRSKAFSAATDVVDRSLRSPRVTGPDLRASLEGQAALIRLDQGEVPDSLQETLTRLLDSGDRQLVAKGRPFAAPQVTTALGIAFHRTIHTEDLLSPLASGPADFLGPFRESKSYAALSRHDRRPRSRFAFLRRRRKARRLLFLSAGNWHFVSGIIDHLEDIPEVEVRRLLLTDAPPGTPSYWLPGLVQNRLSETRKPIPDELRRALVWADTIMVDWCDAGAAWASLHVPPGPRLVVRLHSMEALSVHPHVLDWDRVDDLIFVSTPLQRLTMAVVPRLGSAGRPRHHVLPNDCRLDRFPTDKNSSAGRTIGMVQWSSTVKDPLWALDVLAILRQDDESWRLRLIGKNFNESLTARGRAYRDAVRRRLEHPDVRGAVEFVPFTTNLAEPLRGIGFILSASMREAFPVSLVEAAASGAVPVVRNWPLLAPYGGPCELYPDSWIVATPEEAAARIREHADPALRTAAGAEARRFVVDRYDWPTVAFRYEDLLIG